MTTKEYHSNGMLAYICTFQDITIEQSTQKEYSNCIVRPDGSHFIRVGFCAKFHDNGIMAWGLEYDNFGRVDKTKSYPSKRKDGSLIQY